MLIDSHCHLDDERFASERDAVIQRARQVGVMQQVIPGCQAQHWQRIHDLCQQHDFLFPAYGLHPMFLSQHRPEHLQALADWIEQKSAVAVGEFGLDFYLKDLDPKQQHYYFDAQLQIAKASKRPVILHARKSVDLILKQLRQVSGLRGVIHSFSGSLQQAQKLIDLGFYLGIGGVITYERAQKMRKLVQKLPLSAMVLETDAPDQPLSTHRGVNNEPAYLPEVAQTLAQLRQQPLAEIIMVTTTNTRQLFDL
ncbi:TatD family hydrolase [Candidatus Venteria ishoeyi]|uniref:Putative deoxyribonuclease YjjV n=1 Tax=Candidatus Venteria ishoeyi TaxID=1899563 RepID=A0A1H6F8F6_9GAMM|nr:TatD family hydrolase [Candidatus Venteria ishoeyi]MDM8548092.1 TatD family hydrolase [Candidatus Venteria ishoeyi]SEH05691.1 putative deoxyribonuclease YjjV [Candidatus Venteria ishoeyi]